MDVGLDPQYGVPFVSKLINSHGLLNKTWFNKSLYSLFKRRITLFIEKIFDLISNYMVY